jgi:transcriptional regulator with XRE-family HTH domain
VTALAELLSITPLDRELRRARGWRSLGVQVSCARAERRLLIQCVADRSALSWERVRAIECGSATPAPSDAELEAIARALDVPVEPFIVRAARVRKGWAEP